jgi:ATP-dependent Lhr-like helicase
MSLTARLAQEELRLRRDLRNAFLKGGREGCVTMLQSEWKLDRNNAERAAHYVERQHQATPLPIDRPIQVERVLNDRTLIYIFHSVAGRGVNRSLIWLLSHRLGRIFGSIVGNHDDHAFLLSFNAKRAPSLADLRECMHPDNFREDMRSALEKTDLLGAKFRPICETGQLLPRRNANTNPGAKRNAAWNGRLLFETFRKYEPEHPLLREAVREILEDDLDRPAALEQVEHLYKSEWEVFDLPRPSPMAIPLFAFFNRETLQKQDADSALDELVGSLYEQWGIVP